MRALILITLSIISLYFAGCKSCKNQGDNVINNNTNQGIQNYLPTKTGSWWLFSRDDGNEFKRESTGEFATINTRQYNKFKYTKMADMDEDPEYFGKFDNRYYAVFDFVGDGSQYYEAIVLKDTPKVGDTWTNTGNITYTSINVDIKIDAKILSLTDVVSIPDTTFKNAIKVEYILTGTALAIPINAGRIYNWFVPGVGIVKQDYDVSISSFYSKKYVDILKSYHIAP